MRATDFGEGPNHLSSSAVHRFRTAAIIPTVLPQALAQPDNLQHHLPACVMAKHTSKEAAAAACRRPLSSSCARAWAADLSPASACCTASCSRLSASSFALQHAQLPVRLAASVVSRVTAISACCTAFCSQCFACIVALRQEDLTPFLMHYQLNG